jgi:hypothetical protein
MIAVKLKCRCTDSEVELHIRERRDDEDILNYMKFVERQIGVWHADRECTETRLEYVKIPVSARPDAKLGQR